MFSINGQIIADDDSHGDDDGVETMIIATHISLAKDSAKSFPCIISFYLWNHLKWHVL